MISLNNVVVALILNEKNEFLLQKKDLEYSWFPGKWCLFGGKIEDMENAEEAIVRELREELGIDIERVNLKFQKKFNYENVRADGLAKRCGEQYCYTYRFQGDVSDIKLREGCGFAFFDYSEIKYHPVAEHDLVVIKDYFKEKI